jgi:hypothetical protein
MAWYVARTTALEVALLLDSPEATGKVELVFISIPVSTLNLPSTFLTQISISVVSTSLSALNIRFDDFKLALAVT